MARIRLDKLLVTRGLAPSRDRARELIAAGEVVVAGHIAAKPATMVDAGVGVEIRARAEDYASRGAHKLIAGLDAFEIDPTDKVCLDVGASTGGFTDVLLRRGARKVFALDVGYGQLAWKLRSDDRVIVLERENVRHTAPDKLSEPCDLAVIDVSFISLTLILENVARLMTHDGTVPGGRPIVALVKPQFEVGKGLVGKGGVVRDDELRQQAVAKVISWARGAGFVAGDTVESPIRGPAGNVEFLLLLRSPR